MTQDRKIAGMTFQQIGILVGLGIFACLLFGLTGVLILRRGFRGLSQAPITTSTIPSTPTILVTLTPALTETPTPVPYEQLIPDGWIQFKTTLVEIWLPSTFKAAKTQAGEELAASTTNSKVSLYKMRVSISYEPLGSDSLDTHLNARIVKLDPSIRVVERRRVSLNSTEAIRLLLEGRIQTVDINELVYVIQDGTAVWFVEYVAQINEFYDTLPSFERSAQTFRIVR